MSIYTGFKTAIGSNVTGYNAKVFPLVAPESTSLPYCTYQQIFTNKIKTHDGYTGEGWGDYQFDFYSSTYIGAKTASEQWFNYIKNYRGTIGTLNVQDVQLINEFDDMDNVSSVIRYRTTIELKFYFNTI
jgi:hypothetical protein